MSIRPKRRGRTRTVFIYAPKTSTHWSELLAVAVGIACICAYIAGIAYSNELLMILNGE